ncbi:MAG: class I SAM-dependent methyltransferase [Woeseiaceae bacterium]
MTAVDSASHQSFRDHFSGHSRSYACYRPTYPESLFAFLADCCAERRLAWDCATGNGQAARALIRYFERVLATDASEAQIRAAESHPDIEFLVARAEATRLADNSTDLITVAQALHWFDITDFFDEAHRVLVPGGVLAVWSYERCFVSVACDALIKELYADIIGPYWPPQRRLVEDGYRGIELPMPSIAPPEFTMKIDWTAQEMLGYLRTWSASQRYLADRGSDPVSLIEDRLNAAWGEGTREVSWPLNVKIGRV